MAVGRGGDPLDQAEIDAALAAAMGAPAPIEFNQPEPAAEPAPVAAPAAPPSAVIPQAPPAPAALFAPLDEPDSGTGIEPQNLNMVMDIPLEISVELGRKRMSIRQILDLGSGSIVELDKIAGEPVDLLVNGRLVARGEVVVIEDNFGVRITEIIGAAARAADAGKAPE